MCSSLSNWRPGFWVHPFCVPDHWNANKIHRLHTSVMENAGYLWDKKALWKNNPQCAHVIRTFFVLMSHYSIGDKEKEWSKNVSGLKTVQVGWLTKGGKTRRIAIFERRVLTIIILLKKYFKSQNSYINCLINSPILNRKNMTWKCEIMTYPWSCTLLS